MNPNLGYSLLSLFTIVVFGFLWVNESNRLRTCDNACGGDPVQECTSTRVICIGKAQVYVKEVFK